MPGLVDRVYFQDRYGADGLRDFTHELRAVGGGLQKASRDTNAHFATEMAERAKAAAAGANLGPRVNPAYGKARNHRAGKVDKRVLGTIKVLASQREGKVAVGGGAAPTFWGQEFGGSRGLSPSRHLSARANRDIRRRTAQFPRHLGRDGYWLFPAFAKFRETIPERFWKQLDEAVLKRLFPD